MEKPKYLLIVKPANGLIVRDLPRPESQGAIRLRAEPKGRQLYAYDIHNFDGVPYARLVPRDPNRPEWARVKEADGLTVYADVVAMDAEETNGDLAAAIHDLADAIRSKN